jgi:F-type H+-transporting ATPase subunit 8
MPQLISYYFINQVIFAVVLLVLMIYILSKYTLPRFLRLYLIRLLISMQVNNNNYK